MNDFPVASGSTGLRAAARATALGGRIPLIPARLPVSRPRTSGWC
ncbi:hypothetical protein [Streptomyces sp. NPDC006289]